MLRFALVAAIALPAAVPAAARDTGNPLRVTTDSIAYCQELAMRVVAQPGATTEPVRSLTEEGKRLCATGHVRTGIAKLRRALRAAQPDG